MLTANLPVNDRNRLIPLLAVLVVVAVCVALGFWQLDRADQKRTILAQRLSQSEAAIRSLPGDADLVAADPALLVHAPVEISGKWLPQYEILLDNQVHGGRAGCHVLTPLRVDGSNTVVLINRGWVPWGPDRAILPQTSASEEPLSVRGRVWVPVADGFRLGKEQQKKIGEWQRLWQYLDLERYSSLLDADYELLPFVVRMDKDKDKNADGTSSLDQQTGYRRDWFAPTDLWIHRHMAYAVQWFGLALVAVFLYWLRRRKTKTRPDG